MEISYPKALDILETIARVLSPPLTATSVEWVPPDQAVGRVAARTICSPFATPEFDTSAMDGYAISSELTSTASTENPITFRVCGIIAAGDDPPDVLPSPVTHDGVHLSLEIMTGGRFPHSGTGMSLDACVKAEDVIVRLAPALVSADQSIGTSSKGIFITLTKPVPKHANRRVAGHDIQRGDTLLQSGQTIHSTHIMPLLATGISSLPVLKPPRIAIWSTGRELTSGPSTILDINGPFLATASREWGAEATLLGALDDIPAVMVRELRETVTGGRYDLVITTGAVSVGRFDTMQQTLEALGAEIEFHGLAIRPGHPVLFARVPVPGGKIPVFGLPGNPGAAAACFRFLVVPFLRVWMGRERERPAYARARKGDPWDLGSGKGKEGDWFRPGVVKRSAGEVVVEIAERKDCGSGMVRPFGWANCWVHLKLGKSGDAEGRTGDHGMGVVPCYPMWPGGVQG